MKVSKPLSEWPGASTAVRKAHSQLSAESVTLRGSDLGHRTVPGCTTPWCHHGRDVRFASLAEGDWLVFCRKRVFGRHLLAPGTGIIWLEVSREVTSEWIRHP